MAELFQSLKGWFLGLGESYGVDPLVFGAIYVGAIPLFLLSTAWLVRRRKAGTSTVIPTLCAGFFFISAYLYIAVVGHDIPIWVWAVLALLVAYGIFSAVRGIRKRSAEPPA